jgi:hypothetical protein
MKKSFGMLFPLAMILMLAMPGTGHTQDGKAYVGIWEGALSVGGMELEIILDLSLDVNQQLTGNIDVPAQGAMDIPLGDFKIEGKKITFVIDDPNVQGDPIFAGELNEDGTVLSGSFSQGGAEGTFEVTKK